MALVSGGNEDGVFVELYSPEGKCRHNLSVIESGGIYLHSPTLAFIDEKIYACAGKFVGGITVTNF